MRNIASALVIMVAVVTAVGALLASPQTLAADLVSREIEPSHALCDAPPGSGPSLTRSAERWWTMAEEIFATHYGPAMTDAERAEEPVEVFKMRLAVLYALNGDDPASARQLLDRLATLSPRRPEPESYYACKSWRDVELRRPNVSDDVAARASRVSDATLLPRVQAIADCEDQCRLELFGGESIYDPPTKPGDVVRMFRRLDAERAHRFAVSLVMLEDTCARKARYAEAARLRDQPRREAGRR